MLRERYPATFDVDNAVPFAIGIHKQLADLIGLHPAYAGLHGWCRHPAYLRAIHVGGPRVNLDGSQDGEVSDMERALACMRLNKIGDP